MNGKFCIIITLIFVIWMAVSSCTKQNVPSDEPNTMAMDSIPFLAREVAGSLENKLIDEVSGLVASTSFPGYLWTHNDSGDEARIFLTDGTGKHVSEIKINGAINRDWEDITSGTDPVSLKNFVLIGDIGDNNAKYKFVTLYQVNEPSILPVKDTTLQVAKKYTVTYPDGPRDAESLMVDPFSNDIFILTKREPQIFVYRIAYPYPTTDTIVAEKTATLPFTQLVAGDISQNGLEILIKNYDSVYYFKRNTNESVSSTLQKMPVVLPYIREPQGEAICFSKDGTSYYTVSEKTGFGLTPVLYKYRRK